MLALGQRSSGVLLLLTAGLMVMSAASAEELVDLRTSFGRIEPYTRPPSPPVTREFSIPGPGTLRMRTTMSPWFRSTDPVLFRSIEPVDGRDEGAWAGHVPGVERLTFTSTPEIWVDGGDLTILTEYRVRKPRPRLVVGLFPSTVRSGDGSTLQLANSVQVTIEWTADASGLPAQPAAGLEGRWADADGIVTLRAQGDVVAGTYAFRDGRMSGTRSGQRTTGFWMQSLSNRRCSTEREGTSYWGRYELTLDGDRLEGRYGYCEGPLEMPWSFKRVP